ncbi:hypothetical protein [Pengzhenrongella sp.]|uniref:hypothetical protein n=1 Tax=Pengzhenrongella sp. TaxID=2888820 RepID=UPI002F942422
MKGAKLSFLPVWHETWSQADDSLHRRLVGVFTDPNAAARGIARARALPGFRDAPQSFGAMRDSPGSLILREHVRLLVHTGFWSLAKAAASDPPLVHLVSRGPVSVPFLFDRHRALVGIATSRRAAELLSLVRPPELRPPELRPPELRAGDTSAVLQALPLDTVLWPGGYLAGDLPLRALERVQPADLNTLGGAARGG